jgi:hypothetical protein
LLPEQVEKSLKALGSDGAAVRGALERDFADYASKAATDRRRVRRVLLASVLQPLILPGVKRGADWFLKPSPAVVDKRLADLRAKAEGAIADARDAISDAGSAGTPSDVSTSLPPVASVPRSSRRTIPPSG